MGISENNPQSNEIENPEKKEKIMNKNHMNVPIKREETWEREAVLLLPQSRNYCLVYFTSTGKSKVNTLWFC